MEEGKIVLTWNIEEVEDTSRVGMTYCFKNCDKNQN